MLKILIAVSLSLSPTIAFAKAHQTGDLPRRDGKPLIDLSGLETEYGVVRTSEGTRLRTILTRPLGTTGTLPAILLTQWVSCGSIDVPADKATLLRQIALRSGMVFMRVERSGTGDSEGVACNALDFDTEVRHYREALNQLTRHPWVDESRIVIFGSSLGANTAPLVAEGRKIAGIAVQGGGALTYLERMIAFDRLYLERSGKYSPADVHGEMARRIPFHVEYLVNGRTPEVIEQQNPQLRGVWQTIRGGAEAPPHYGRPYAWHQQAAKKNFLDAWTKVTSPVLVVYGEYDQFEIRHGHQLIADTLNRLRPGSATFIEVPRADHDIELYRSATDAYAYRNATVQPDLLPDLLIKWAKRVTSYGAR